MGTSTSGSDVIVVTISRSCAKQFLLALTLALGGTPVKQISNGKGKGKGKGGGGKTQTGGKTQVGGKKQVGGKSQLGKSQAGKKKTR